MRCVLDGSGKLEKEDEFVRRCMDNLMTASSRLQQVRTVHMHV